MPSEVPDSTGVSTRWGALECPKQPFLGVAIETFGKKRLDSRGPARYTHPMEYNPTPKDIRRFLIKIYPVDDPGGDQHWIWTSAFAGHGASSYGVFFLKTHNVLAKYFAYNTALEAGQDLMPFDPELDELLRICKMPGCIAPHHHMPRRPPHGKRRRGRRRSRKDVNREYYLRRTFCAECGQRRPCPCAMADRKAS